MLILTRRIGQQVFINHGVIQVKVLKADNHTITLGFYAPPHIEIDREEVYLKKTIRSSIGAVGKDPMLCRSLTKNEIFNASASFSQLL